LNTPTIDNEAIETGVLTSYDKNSQVQIFKSIPRFVDSGSYAESFGHEWHYFKKTQLDSFTGTTISSDRWCDITGYSPKDMSKKIVLEAGCGAGRFLEVLAPFAKKLIGMDMTKAIDVAFENLNTTYPNVDFLQADLNNHPIKKNSIDLVYSIGVLHHIPDTLKGIKGLLKCVKPGGELAVWLYGPQGRGASIRNFYRKIGSRTDPEKLLKFLKKYVPFALKTHNIPIIGKLLKWTIFPAPSYPQIPIPDDLRKEWSILDAFDGYATKITRNYTEDELHQILIDAGLENIKKGKVYNSFIGRKPI
jgi:SAM-dependent methyltransferase